MGMFSQKRESEFAKNLPWHGNGARLFFCDLDVEKASVVKTSSERNLVKRQLFWGLYTISLEMIEF